MVVAATSLMANPFTTAAVARPTTAIHRHTTNRRLQDRQQVLMVIGGDWKTRVGNFNKEGGGTSYKKKGSPGNSKL
jgi:hypothetical protein